MKTEIKCECGHRFTVVLEKKPYMVWSNSNSITYKYKCPKCGKKHTVMTEYKE